MKRKIVQIAVIQARKHENSKGQSVLTPPSVLAVADDGTLWGHDFRLDEEGGDSNFPGDWIQLDSLPDSI